MKVEQVTLNVLTGEMTKHELKGEELEKWKELHGYGNNTTDTVEPDPEREAPSASDQSK